MASEPANSRDDDYWADVEQVFASVMNLEPLAAASVLDALCARRPDVRAEVDSLLAAHHRAAGFLSSPADDRGERADAASRLGEQVGSFTLVDLIATGGMGVVYRAERAGHDFTQQVAVKLIAAPMGHPEAARRFRAERQILAALHHPHIVTLLDGGIADGEAYLVMEYVEGEPLTAYCASQMLTVRARVELFRHVCGAVEYLHQNFVVHRDLKPTNILVTRDGVPKVLDFGIAKLVEPPDAATTGEVTQQITRAEDRVLTPNYASPEQLRGLRATVASDVYSLGVVLYELLTGAPPFDTAAKPFDETLHLVLDTEPARPSEAASRTSTLPYDRRAIRGDLDAIVLRALRKAPEERYASARALSDDLGRYLEGQPVEAREPSLGYVMKRLAARHKTVFALSAGSLAVIVALLVFSLWQARIARAERDRAEARFQDVRRLANSVIYDLHDAIANLPGATPARQLLVARALEYLDRLAAEARNDPALKRELADAYQRLAQIQNGGLGANLGDTQVARRSYDKALAIRRELVARTPAEARDVLGLALLEFDLGTLERVQGQVAPAEAFFEAAATRFEQLRSAGTGDDAAPTRLAAVYQRLAELQAFAGKRDQALQSAQKAVMHAEAAWGRRPHDAATRSVLAASSFGLAEALADRQRFREALERTRQVRALLEAALADNPLAAQETRILLFALNGETRYLTMLGETRDAIAVGEHALAVAEEAWRRDPRDNWSRTGVAVAAGALGNVLFAAGDSTGSAQRYRQAVDVATKAIAEDPRNAFLRLELAAAEHGLGHALLDAPSRGRRAEGCALLRRVQTFWLDLQSKGPLPADEAADLSRLPSLLTRCPS